MYKWDFRVLTIEKGWIRITIKASNKKDAIDKGFERFNKKGLSYANKFECKLTPRF